MKSKSRSRREYLIPTDNIIVFDNFFNLTKKSNLIGIFCVENCVEYNSTQFFDNLVVAYFLGHPVYTGVYVHWMCCATVCTGDECYSAAVMYKSHM